MNLKDALSAWKADNPDSSPLEENAYKEGYYDGYSDKNHSELLKEINSLRQDLGLNNSSSK